MEKNYGRELKMSKCKHIEECLQNVAESDFPLCLGDMDEWWNQEDCFRCNDLCDDEPKRMKPREWQREKVQTK